MDMVFTTPSVRAATFAEIAPVAATYRPQKRLAASSVDATRADGADADAVPGRQHRRYRPPENTTPRRVSRCAESPSPATADSPRSFGDAELPGRFLAGHPLEVAQDDDAPVVVGQAAQFLVQHARRSASRASSIAAGSGAFATCVSRCRRFAVVARSLTCRLPGPAVSQLGTACLARPGRLADGGRGTWPERILGVLVVVQVTAAGRPDHRGVRHTRAARALLSGRSRSGFKSFAIGHPAPPGPTNLAMRCSNDHAQRTARHRTSTSPSPSSCFIIFAAGRLIHDFLIVRPVASATLLGSSLIVARLGFFAMSSRSLGVVVFLFFC